MAVALAGYWLGATFTWRVTESVAVPVSSGGDGVEFWSDD